MRGILSLCVCVHLHLPQVHELAKEIDDPREIDKAQVIATAQMWTFCSKREQVAGC
jgi:hypothetical protein